MCEKANRMSFVVVWAMMVGLASLEAAPWFTVISAPKPVVHACGKQVEFKIRGVDAKTGLYCNQEVMVELLENTHCVQRKKVRTDDQGILTVRHAMKKPGWLMVRLCHKNSQGTTRNYDLAGAMYGADKLQPARPMPGDFLERWQAYRRERTESLPLDLVVTKDEGSSSRDVTVYQVKANLSVTEKVYGCYILPTQRSGKLPLLVNVPGAGAAADIPVLIPALPKSPGEFYPNGSPKHIFPGTAMLILNVHTYDPFAPAASMMERHKQAAQKKENYFFYAYDTEEYRYLKVAVAHARILDEIIAREEIDGTKVGYFGFSQGGWFGLILGALTQKFQKIIVWAPGGCDMFAEDVKRGKTWPYLPYHGKRTQGAVRNAEMLDGANMVKWIRCPLVMHTGLADNCCLPSGIYAAYNAASSKNRKIIMTSAVGHSVTKDFPREITVMIQDFSAR